MKPITQNTRAVFFALLAAALYALNAPFSKLLLSSAAPSMTAAFLYLGAGIGLFFVRSLSKKGENDAPMTKKELPYLIGMIVLDIAAPILLMMGLLSTNAANVSLLNNFEIVATAVIAFALFGEAVSRKTTLAIFLVTLASIVLGFEGTEGLVFNRGSLLVLGACVCWGLENNCTRALSDHDTRTLTTVKGFGSGSGALIVAFLSGEMLPAPLIIGATLALGFFAYGLSINFYILAQRALGAAKTAAFYSIAPFLGVLFSFVFLGERVGLGFGVGFLLMVGASLLLIGDT